MVEEAHTTAKLTKYNSVVCRTTSPGHSHTNSHTDTHTYTQYIHTEFFTYVATVSIPFLAILAKMRNPEGGAEAPKAEAPKNEAPKAEAPKAQ